MMARVAMYCKSSFSELVVRLNCVARRSTKLDAEKRLALQEEKQSLESKLLEV